MEWHEQPYNNWTESDVGSWLKSIGIKEIYITKMTEEEVTGPVLSTIKREYLSSTIGMKSAQIEHLLEKRDELLKTNQPDTKKKGEFKGKRREKEVLVSSR
ncbi:hypothetical protein FQA47_002137 [Oryzias melastigma]|nr:hypothetical protein FQA47_002137 [Oryzias melastigma]